MIALLAVGCESGEGEHNGNEESSEHGNTEIENSGGHGGEGSGRSEAAERGEGRIEDNEAGATQLARTDTFDEIRSGGRMILKYDSKSNAFVGTVKNTTTSILDRVRVEVHLSNGTELGPTTPTQLQSGGTLEINLPSTEASFLTWSAHAEVGVAQENETGGEHGAVSSGGGAGEHGGRGGEGIETGSGEDPTESENEAASSSPLILLDQRWEGVINGLESSFFFDSAQNVVTGSVKNVSGSTACYVQVEPHIRQGTTTVMN